MNFCVLVKISKHKISFWYQSGTTPYEPLVIKDTNEIPLYFYVNGTDFIFGEDVAIERYNSNDPNAFGNYFDIIKDPSNHFTIAGNKKPVKQLIYHGIEKYLNFFITQVLYKNDSLESYRQNFPLRFWFEQDIEEKEKSLIENIFIEAGYDNIEQINYNQSLFEVLSENKVISPDNSVLMLNGISNTLYMELYKRSTDFSNSFSKLDGHGADPSVKILAEMILEDILAQESYLTIDKEKEVKSLLTYSAERLENITPIIKGEAILTDGKKHYFEVKQRVLNDRLLYYSNDRIINAAINELLSVNNVTNENLTILLGSKEINTAYLINKLLVKYPNVFGVENKYTKETLKLIFSKISKSGYLVKNTVLNSPPKQIDVIYSIPKPTTRVTSAPVPAGSNPPVVTTDTISTPPIPPLPSTRMSTPPVPSRLIPPLPPTKLSSPPVPPTKVGPPPIPTGLKPPVLSSLKPTLVPPTKVGPPQMPTGLKPPVVPPTRVVPPPVPPSMKPPPVPSGVKLPPPPPKSKK